MTSAISMVKQKRAIRDLSWSVLLILAVLALLLTPKVKAQDVTDEEVRKAIKRGIEYLYNAQVGGNWGGPSERDVSGYNAIALYALLAAGEDIQANDKIMSAVEWMIATDSFGTYDVGLRAHVWAKLPPRYLEMLEKDATLLHDALDQQGKAHYTCDFVNPSYDNSTTQYNFLGVWEANKRGIEWSSDYWERIERGFMTTQNDAGEWGYKNASKWRPSMTAAGVTALFITNDFLHSEAYKEPGVSKNHPVYQTIQKGVDWFDNNFGNQKYGEYTWVGIERVGVASGYKYFNNKDWYRTGASIMVRGQAANGFLKSGGKDHGRQFSNHAFALIFLAAGRKPVMINKLKVPGMHWDNRPRDIAKLTSWVSDESEQQMLWQLIEIDRSSQDFMDAQILYLASDQEITIDAGGKAKIKDYIDAGGLFLTNSDNGSSTFDASIEEFAKELYPDAQWKRIPDNDPVYNIVYRVRPDRAPLWGLYNGVRWLMIHSPEDIAWSLHVQNMGNVDHWQVMANIYHYATERGKVRPKLAKHYMELKSGASGKNVNVKRIAYDGNWNPEPASWVAGSIAMRNKNKLSPQVREVDLAVLSQENPGFAHLVGSGDQTLTEQQIEQIRLYAENGGTILIEAAGGDNQFYLNQRRALAAAFADMGATVQRIDPTHPIVTGSGIDGVDASQVGYRAYRSLRVKTPTRQPSLEAIMINGEPRIILSGDDFSHAMLDQPIWGVFGYNHDSAVNLMINMIQYSNQ